MGLGARRYRFELYIYFANLSHSGLIQPKCSSIHTFGMCASNALADDQVLFHEGMGAEEEAWYLAVLEETQAAGAPSSKEGMSGRQFGKKSKPSSGINEN